MIKLLIFILYLCISLFTPDAVSEINSDADTQAYLLENAIEVPNYSQDYYIRINVLANCVTVYQKYEGSTYIPYTAFVTSTGTYTLHEGVYAISDHYEWRELIGGSYGHWAVRIYQGLLFHSCGCAAMDINTVDISQYNKLGTADSLGCMRLRDADAKWIYDNCPAGTLVEFYDSEDPGPLGKPEIDPLPETATADPTAVQ